MIEALNRVLIIGGGIGGMATAISLRKRDVPVELIDADPQWRVAGAGITITGPTLRAYRDLGLLEAIGREGFFTTGQRLFLFDGTPLAELDQFPIEPGLPASGAIMRPKLHEIMSSEVRRLGADVRLGIKAERFEQGDDEVRVAFTDGSEGTYDLVVACDGIYSQTRAMLFPDAVQPQYIGQMSWRVIAPRPPELDKAEFFFGHENIGGINPCSQEEVYGFILNPEPEMTRLDPSEEPEVLRSLMADFGGSMAEIREGIGPHSSIMRRPFEYAFQPKPWHVGRIILIGDAAHATTPHLASGAGIAVEDALVLVQELERNAPEVEAALVSFTERRFERCRHVVESSVAIGKRQLERAPPAEIGKRMAEAMQFLAGPL